VLKLTYESRLGKGEDRDKDEDIPSHSDREEVDKDILADLDCNIE